MLPTRGTVQRFNGLDAESDQCLRIISLLWLPYKKLAAAFTTCCACKAHPGSPAAMHSSEPNCSRPATHYISMNLRSSQQDFDSNKTCQAYFSKFLYWFVCLPWAQKTIWSMVEQAETIEPQVLAFKHSRWKWHHSRRPWLVGTRVATSKVCE